MWQKGKRKRSGYSLGQKRSRGASYQAKGLSRRANPRVAGFLGIEKKFFDTKLLDAALVTSIDATGGLHNPSGTVCLNAVAAGDNEQERDGRKMTMKYISVCGTVRSAVLTGINGSVQQNTVYIALVIDTQCNGANLASELVFKNGMASSQGATSVFRNLEYESRFKVLKVIRGRLPLPNLVYNGTDTDIGGTIFPFKMNVNLKDMPVNFKNTTGVIANITDNSLNLICFGYDTDSASLFLSYNARLRFVG